MQPTVTSLPHMPYQPLSIERDWTNGFEKIIIEGVVYDAEYFRTFAHPKTNVLYAVSQEDGLVRLTIIQTEEQAKEFFENVGGS